MCPGFESQAQHVRFFQFIFELLCEKNKNNYKEAGIGPIYFTKIAQDYKANLVMLIYKDYN